MKENIYSSSISRYYDKIILAGYYSLKSSAKELRKIFGEKKNILEVGIGTGLLAKEMVTLGYHISGIDFSKNMLNRAKKRLGKKSKFYLQDILELTLPEKYGGVYSEGGIWWFSREKKGLFLQSHLLTKHENLLALKKLSKVLENNGLLAINIQKKHKTSSDINIGGNLKYSQKVIDKGKYINKEYFVKSKKNIVAYQRSKFRRFKKNEEKDLFDKSGFRLIKINKNKHFIVLKKIK